MFVLDEPIKQRTTLVYKRSETNIEYAKIDRMFVLDDQIKQRTTLVYTRSETNVEYTKIDRMFIQDILSVLDTLPSSQTLYILGLFSV
jgi:uncharacterized protein (DUF2164 family)